jgi:hypothetical protein
VLSRGTASAQLEVFCQDGQKQPSMGIQLDGAENAESYWLPPVVIRYTGKKVRDKPPTYELTLAVGPAVESRYAGAPSSLTLACRPADVAILPPGAVLVPGTKRDNDTKTSARWRPSARRTIAVLRCEFAPNETAKAWRLYAPAKDWPPMFARVDVGFSGVEWADENSDMVVQEGAYRQILPPP